jgi:hypothetical protein
MPAAFADAPEALTCKKDVFAGTTKSLLAKAEADFGVSLGPVCKNVMLSVSWGVAETIEERGPVVATFEAFGYVAATR